MLETARELVTLANVVKLGEDELSDLAGGTSIEDKVRSLWHPGLRVVAVTKGAGGADLFTESYQLTCGGFAVDAVSGVSL